VISLAMSRYDGLGTLFDLNCLRSSAMCGDFPFGGGHPGGESKMRELGGTCRPGAGLLILTIRSSGGALCGAKPKTETDGSEMDQAK
jgi:hypothetical protein